LFFFYSFNFCLNWSHHCLVNCPHRCPWTPSWSPFFRSFRSSKSWLLLSWSAEWGGDNCLSLTFSLNQHEGGGAHGDESICGNRSFLIDFFSLNESAVSASKIFYNHMVLRIYGDARVLTRDTEVMKHDIAACRIGSYEIARSCLHGEF